MSIANIHKLHNVSLLSIFIFLVACTPQVAPSKTDQYSEDLSIYRPEIESEDPANSLEIETVPEEELPFTAEPIEDLTYALDSLLDTIAKNSRVKGYIQAYTIQVYTGNSREDAEDAKALLYEVLPDSYPKLQYIQPNFKVKVGTFYSKYEATQTFDEIREDFPNAIIIPERIKVD